MRRGDTLCGAIRAGGGGWASSPTDAGGYCNAPSICACAMLEAISTADPTIKTSAPKPIGLCIIASLRSASGLPESIPRCLPTKGQSDTRPLFDFFDFASEFFYFERKFY